MMYSVRKNATGHGSTNINIFICVLMITAILTWQYGRNYFVIFIASSLLHLLIETGLFLTGLRKSVVYAYGYKLPRWADICLRAFVDGPAFCVPAFFIADQVIKGNGIVGMTGAALIVGAASLYIAIADCNDIRKLPPGETALSSRRAMTRPAAVMLLSLINTIGIVAILLMPPPYRSHAIIYIAAYSCLVILFYLINYNFGVRLIEIYDEDKKEFTKPGPLFQAAGLTYDSIYEMAFVISPAYWITFYLGLFQYQ